MKFNFAELLKGFAQDLIDWRNRVQQAGPIARKNLIKNFQIKTSDDTKRFDEILVRKTQSMQDSQGIGRFSGSGYNGPGNVDHEKTHSNKSQRNF